MRVTLSPPAEFIAPPNFRAAGHETAICIISTTRLICPLKDVYIFLVVICGQKGYGN